MQDEANFEILLFRLFANELTEKEEADFLDQLKTDIERKQRFEEYESLWRLAALKRNNEPDLIAEFARLKKKIESNSARIIPMGLPVADKRNIYSKGRFWVTLVRAVSVAASVLLVVIFLMNYADSRKVEKSSILVSDRPIKIQNPLISEFNDSEKPRNIKLIDGSEVVLYTKSRIVYQQVFDSIRKIILNGKARFIVAKDRSKPFVVFGGGLQTTAIGTQFTVSAHQSSKNTLVQLHEGKVIVTSIPTDTGSTKEYFLTAEQELLFNRKTFRVSINNISKPNKPTKKTDERSIESPDVPQNKPNPWYMFNNQSLAQVFDQLAFIYNVSIKYKKADVQNRRFIGMFNQTDSIRNVLLQIAAINDLKLKENEYEFVLYK